MTINPPQDPHVTAVADRAAAELLAHPEIARLLKPFMRGECTVSQAAGALGVGVEALHYRVVRFERAGLLEVVRTEPRRGRACKVYRASSRHYRIPASLLSDQTLDALTQGQSWEQEIRAATGRLRPRFPVAAVTVHLTDKGSMEWGLHARDAPEPEPEAVPGLLQLRSAALFLDPADAEAFAGELVDLHARYQQKRGRSRYGLLLDLAPLERPVDGGPGLRPARPK